MYSYDRRAALSGGKLEKLLQFMDKRFNPSSSRSVNLHDRDARFLKGLSGSEQYVKLHEFPQATLGELTYKGQKALKDYKGRDEREAERKRDSERSAERVQAEAMAKDFLTIVNKEVHRGVRDVEIRGGQKPVELTISWRGDYPRGDYEPAKYDAYDFEGEIKDMENAIEPKLMAKWRRNIKHVRVSIGEKGTVSIRVLLK